MKSSPGRPSRRTGPVPVATQQQSVVLGLQHRAASLRVLGPAHRRRRQASVRVGAPETALVRQWLSDLNNLMTLVLDGTDNWYEEGELDIHKRNNKWGMMTQYTQEPITARPDHSFRPVRTQQRRRRQCRPPEPQQYTCTPSDH